MGFFSLCDAWFVSDLDRFPASLASKSKCVGDPIINDPVVYPFLFPLQTTRLTATAARSKPSKDLDSAAVRFSRTVDQAQGLKEWFEDKESTL